MLYQSDIFCIGNALIDVFARDEGHLLSSRHGINQPKQHLEIEKLKELVSELPKCNPVSGGGAANAAKILGLMGAKASFTGSVGCDPFGELFEKSLSEAGVNLNIKKSTSPTGICLYLDDGKGNIRIAASTSASMELCESDINEEGLKNAAIALIDGFLLHRPGLVHYVLDLAEKNGITIAIDLSSAEIAAGLANGSGILDNEKHDLILFMNEEEAQAFPNALSYFQSITCGKKFPIIAVKLGAKGAIIVAGGEIIHAHTQAITPKNNIGAGDAFCAAFLYAWLKKKPLRECAALGNSVARIVLEVPGTQVDGSLFKKLAIF